MSRADLHCHSRCSAHPSEWFLQRIGTRESYTEVEEVYRRAKARGMDFVTITDHNTIEGARQLVERHPEDCFVSAEATTYFPEDGAKVHVLVYGVTPEQFEMVQQRRPDIYALRDYLREADIACSVAHATYSVNGRLTRELLEKLLLLFDVFEGINGARGPFHNGVWGEILRGLTEGDLARMSRRHGIRPWREDSWRKGVTGGTDDHAGLFIGRAYTESPAADVAGFLQSIRARGTGAGGHPGDHKSLAFAIYKIATDFMREKSGGGGGGFLGELGRLLFEGGRPGVRHWIARQRLRQGRGSKARALHRFHETLAACGQNGAGDVDARIDAFYNGLSHLADDFFAMIAASLEHDLRKGHADRVLNSLSSAIPAAFMVTPFFTTLRHLHRSNREVISGFRHELLGAPAPRDRRVLWFSDTVADLNGVAVTVREVAGAAHRARRSLKLVACPAAGDGAALPPNTLRLPSIYSLTPDFYTAFTLSVPSILTSMDAIAAERPDSIVVSTPGPVGLLGLAAARLLGVPCTAIYHTDFARQADFIIGDPQISRLIDAYLRWFFGLADELRVPTAEYIDLLAARGMDRSRMRVFRRGIDPSYPVDEPARREAWRERLGLPADAFVLLFAGRLGKEKNLDFLLDVHAHVARRRPGARLVIAGDGPERAAIEARARTDGRLVLAGRIDRAELPHVYALADAFVFPSTTDTFGMVVLEAQACGLPALVTDVGGPQEIVRGSPSGFVLPVDSPARWADVLVDLAERRERDPRAAAERREATRAHFRTGYGWDRVLDDIMGGSPAGAVPPPAAPARAPRPRPAAAELAAVS
jgi:glycosyltransferase involved in cell wall biosynthesis